MTHTPARVLLPSIAAAILLMSGVLAGCSSGSDSMDSSGATESVAEAPAGAPDAPVADDAGGSDGAQSLAGDGADMAYAEEDGAAEAPDEPVDPADGFRRSVVRTGDLSMRAADVGQARHQVQRIVDRFRGEVTEENTESGEDGEPAYARMVLRVPSDDFDKVVEALGEVGEESSVSTSADDVTTRLIDLQTRVQTQRRSIARISVLFSQARTIRDIMAIEAELAQRQADLESLERKRAFLAGQAAMSTITVGIDRLPDKKTTTTKADDDGFLAGFSAGWNALRGFGVGVATVAGALLPWLVVAALIGIPAWLLVRSMRRRTTPLAAPAAPAADGPQPSE